MGNLSSTEDFFLKEEYDRVPVVYCKNCLSLKVMILGDDLDYCDDCGCTDTDSTDIETWKEMYKNKYDKEFLINEKHGRE